MNNTLSDLNNALFEQIERIQSEDLTEEEFEKEIKRTQTVAKVTEVIVHNGELALQTMKHLNEYGYGTGPNTKLAPVPTMLEAKK